RICPGLADHLVDTRVSVAPTATLHRSSQSLHSARRLGVPRSAHRWIPRIAPVSGVEAAAASFLRSVPHRRALRVFDTSLMSMPALDDAKRKASSTYNAAADSYDDPANSFWARFGRRTIERLGLRPGEDVLDVCCGSGASALVAAEKVEPNGSVLGVDLSENL